HALRGPKSPKNARNLACAKGHRSGDIGSPPRPRRRSRPRVPLVRSALPSPLSCPIPAREHGFIGGADVRVILRRDDGTMIRLLRRPGVIGAMAVLCGCSSITTLTVRPTEPSKLELVPAPQLTQRQYKRI